MVMRLAGSSFIPRLSLALLRLRQRIAMVLMLILPARKWLGLKDFVTPRHLDNIAKIRLDAPFQKSSYQSCFALDNINVFQPKGTVISVK